MKNSSVILLVFLLFGCSSAIVSSTNDSKVKLLNALQLLKNNRPVPAQELIMQSLAHYENNNDEIGQAHAHKVYGQFYMSDTYHSHKDYFKKNHAYDGTYEKAVVHHRKALDLFANNKDFFQASNSALNLAGTYQRQKKRQKACEAFDLSLELHKKGKELHPNKTVSLPPGFSTMDDAVSTSKKNYGC